MDSGQHILSEEGTDASQDKVFGQEQKPRVRTTVPVCPFAATDYFTCKYLIGEQTAR